MSHRINVKKAADFDQAQSTEICLSERLPIHILASSPIQCRYQVEKRFDYYLLVLYTYGTLTVCCQRCLNAFEYAYENTSTVACCRSEAQAEQLMQEYDSIAAVDNVVDLIDIVTDELHLYVPEKHLDVTECGIIGEANIEDTTLV